MMTDLLLMLSPANLVIFVLVMARLSGMVVAAPFISTIPCPPQTKAILVFLVAFIMYPMVAASATGAVFSGVLDLPSLIILLLKEVAIGALIGFCANLIFVGIQMAGQMLAMQMGLAISDVLDPVTQQNVPVLGQFYMFIACLTFLFINGHVWLFSSIYNSYKIVPIDYNFIFSGPLVEKVIFLTGQIFNIAFELIVPIYAVLIITAMVLGLMSKALPHMNVFMVALPIKIFIGLALMAMFIMPTANYLAGVMENFLKGIDSMFL